MAVYSTEENKKDECLEKTLRGLSKTVNYDVHTIALSVNSATEETKRILKKYDYMIDYVYWNETNLGTAEAINKIWKNRRPGQHCIKMDDDIVIHTPNWIETMLECIQRNPKIGQIGLKRKDCCENPNHSDLQYRSVLQHIPQIPGEKWIVVEQCKHIMGSCVLHSSDLLDKVGFLYQPKLYGFDDVLMSYRSEIAGFINVHLPQIEIDHVDGGGTPYQKWKEMEAGEQFPEVNNLVNRYLSGETPIYYNPFQ